MARRPGLGGKHRRRAGRRAEPTAQEDHTAPLAVLGARQPTADREERRRLLGELEEDLGGHGEWDEVRELVARLLRRGTSAARQRSTFARTGDLRAVAAELICAQAPR
jgi:hypothetical protein